MSTSQLGGYSPSRVHIGSVQITTVPGGVAGGVGASVAGARGGGRRGWRWPARVADEGGRRGWPTRVAVAVAASGPTSPFLRRAAPYECSALAAQRLSPGSLAQSPEIAPADQDG